MAGAGAEPRRSFTRGSEHVAHIGRRPGTGGEAPERIPGKQAAPAATDGRGRSGKVLTQPIRITGSPDHRVTPQAPPATTRTAPRSPSTTPAARTRPRPA